LQALPVKVSPVVSVRIPLNEKVSQTQTNSAACAPASSPSADGGDRGGLRPEPAEEISQIALENSTAQQSLYLCEHHKK